MISDAMVIYARYMYMWKINNIQGTNKDYTPYAMIVHIGTDLKGGHYIIYITIRDNWV